MSLFPNSRLSCLRMSSTFSEGLGLFSPLSVGWGWLMAIGVAFFFFHFFTLTIAAIFSYEPLSNLLMVWTRVPNYIARLNVLGVRMALPLGFFRRTAGNNG
ncbi:hypothetical protein ACFXTI_040109 [Malus domestica]